MKETPLAVAISALIKDDKILLIKRIRGDYIGLLGLPGGKVEKDEHLSEAAIREIFEESGIKSKFKNYLGFVSELLIEDKNILKHLLLHICELEPKTTEILNDLEGELNWFDLNDIKNFKNQIIPSDFLMIENIVRNKKKMYYDCVLEKIGGKYFLKKFE
ncbi:MAG: NUDIX hydrolase [Patescibacteria group bacterium]|nr:NUDIX hydrolase [Patescibacteria group bacterium]